MDIFKQDQLERRAIEQVAAAQGCRSEPEPDRWPDGWIVCEDGERIPAEVVLAFPDQPGAESVEGVPWARGYNDALRRAEQLRREAGKSPSLTVHQGRGIVLADNAIPPAVEQPRDHIAGILEAVTLKTGKYGVGEARGAILVVYHVQYPRPLDVNDLQRIADHAAKVRAPFREVWVVNEYGDPAQRVPFTGSARLPAARSG